MERQIPKNVRQIGNVSGTPKIYVEDYVDTFFSQLCEKAGENPVGAFLVGEFHNTEEEEYVYIYGAVRMHDLQWNGTEYEIDEATWKHGYEDCKQYFEDGEMLGWFVAQSGIRLTAEENTVKLHHESFPKDNTIFIIKDPQENEEAYFAYKMNDLLEIAGHYTYYEKNPCMQNYMVSCRKKNGVSPSETVEDRAAKDFRSIVRAREQRAQRRKSGHLMYALSTCLVLIVVIMGVATMNNFDKMKSVQSTIASLTNRDKDTGKTETSSEENKDGQALAKLEDSSGTDQEDISGNAEEVPETNSETAGNAADGAVGQAVISDTGSSAPDAVAVDGNVVSEGNPQEIQDQADASVQSGSEGLIEENGSDGVYIVEKGDTLAIISKKMYGDISYVDAICRMNGLTDGNLIYIGQKLLLP